MSDPIKEKTETIQVEAQNLLEEIKRFKTQAEEQFKAAEIARKNIDSEGLFAINAKRTCEEHSTAISQLKGAVEADIKSIQTNKQKFDELTALLNANKPLIESDIKIIAENRKAVEKASTEIIESAAKSAAQLLKIDESKKAAELLFTETEQMRDSAIQARNKAEIKQGEIEKLSTQATELAAEITGVHASSTQQSSEISGVLTVAKVDKGNISEIIDHLTKSDAIATGHETRVAALIQQVEELKARVESFLPHATSAGLASSFKDQKLRFAGPQKRWLTTFVYCMVGLVIVSIPSFLNALGIHFGNSQNTGSKWDDVSLNFLMRLPILVPLVWLAIYAGRNYMLSLRLEEDYAYKEAISTAFEGYKRQMEGIPTQAGDVTNPTPMTKLCLNVLSAIAERPGRIYEGKPQDINMMTEAHGVAGQVVDLAQKTIAPK